MNYWIKSGEILPKIIKKVKNQVGVDEKTINKKQSDRPQLFVN
ncbi:hypothetical protein NIES4103_32820 [Nostoc sp. NIES-4103]|nr:hypothetical protein NIES4103_32820 [Nostoc sp. NIES-4103]